MYLVHTECQRSLCSELLYKNGQNLFDTQYMSYYIYMFIWSLFQTLVLKSVITRNIMFTI